MVDKLPFTENLKEGFYIRTFSSNTLDTELKWHFDEEDRTVICEHDTDWMFQIDNELPTIIKKNTPNPTSFAAMFEKKIVVTRSFEARIKVWPKRLKGPKADMMKMADVFFEAIIRSEIHAAAKPNHGFACCIDNCEHTHVHVNSGYIGVTRVKNERHTQGLERSACQFRTMLGG